MVDAFRRHGKPYIVQVRQRAFQDGRIPPPRGKPLGQLAELLKSDRRLHLRQPEVRSKGVVEPAERVAGCWRFNRPPVLRSEEHTSELQSLMRLSYAVFCLKKKKT